MDGNTNMTTIQDVLGDIGAGEAMQPIGVAQIRTAMDTLTKYKAGKSALEKRLIACEQWWKLQHWQEMSPSGNPYDPQWRSAWLFNVIMGKHADAVAAFPEPAIRPREPDDRSEAAMLTSIVPVILEQNDFEETYSDSCWTKMKQGTLAWGVFWDSSKLNGLGDVSIREIDLLNLFWEPGVTDIQKSKNLFYAELVDNDVIRQRYPQVGDTLRSDNTFVSEYKTDDQVDTTNKSLVVDWYYKKIENGKSVLHFCKFVGETVLSATENDPNMQSGLYEDGDYPFVIDALFPVKGSIAGYGYIDIGKSAQEQIDLLNQAILKNSVMASTPRWFVRSDGSISEKEYADWRKPFVHTDGNLGQDSVLPITVSPLKAQTVDVLATYGYADNTRLSTGSGTEKSAAGYVTIGHTSKIQISNKLYPNGLTIRLSGADQVTGGSTSSPYSDSAMCWYTAAGVFSSGVYIYNTDNFSLNSKMAVDSDAKGFTLSWEAGKVPEVQYGIAFAVKGTGANITCTLEAG